MQLKSILSTLLFWWLLFASLCSTLPTSTKFINDNKEENEGGIKFSRRAFGYIQSTFGIARSNQRTITKSYLEKASSRKGSGRYIASGIASTKAFVHSTPGISHVAAGYLTAKKLVRMIKRSSKNSSSILDRRFIQEDNEMMIQKRSEIKFGTRVLQHARASVGAGMQKIGGQMNGLRSFVSKGHTHQQAVGASFVKKQGKLLGKHL